MVWSFLFSLIGNKETPTATLEAFTTTMNYESESVNARPWCLAKTTFNVAEDTSTFSVYITVDEPAVSARNKAADRVNSCKKFR